MSSLKETIDTFSVTDSWNGSKYVYVEDIPGIIVSAFQDFSDELRRRARDAAFSHPEEYMTLVNMAMVSEARQRDIATELM